MNIPFASKALLTMLLISIGTTIVFDLQASTAVQNVAATQLIDAAAKGDESAVGKLLSEGASPFANLGDGITALNSSAANGALHVTRRILLEAIAKSVSQKSFLNFFSGGSLRKFINSRTGTGYPALCYAAKAGDAPLVNLLLQYGGEIDGETISASIESDSSATMIAMLKGARWVNQPRIFFAVAVTQPQLLYS